jgi:hypothetical protein
MAPHIGRAPAAPMDLKRRRPERIPVVSDDQHFVWRPNVELVVGVGKPKRSALDAVLDRCWPIGGPK